MPEGLMGHDKKHGDVKEGETVRKAVLRMEAVPDKVQYIGVKAHEKQDTERRLGDPLPETYILIQQEKHRKDQCQYAAESIEFILMVRDIDGLHKGELARKLGSVVKVKLRRPGKFVFHGLGDA